MSSDNLIQARVDENLKRNFELAAMQRGMSTSRVLRELMASFVERERIRRRRRIEIMETLEDGIVDRVVDLDVGTFVEGFVRR